MSELGTGAGQLAHSKQRNDDWVKVLCPTQHKLGNFGDVPPSSQSLGIVLKKLNLTQQKQATQEKKLSKLNQKNTKNAKPKQTHKN